MTVNEFMVQKMKNNDLQRVNIYYFGSERYRCTVDIKNYFDSEAQFLYGDEEIVKTQKQKYSSELWIFI